MTWQPIETAPRDGTHILWNSADRGSYCVIYWPIYSECFEEGYWQPLPVPHPVNGADAQDRIVLTPEDKARQAFFAEHNEEPVRVTAERIAECVGVEHPHPLIDDIQYALEDAYELGKKYGVRFGSN